MCSPYTPIHMSRCGFGPSQTRSACRRRPPSRRGLAKPGSCIRAPRSESAGRRAPAYGSVPPARESCERSRSPALRCPLRLCRVHPAVRPSARAFGERKAHLPEDLLGAVHGLADGARAPRREMSGFVQILHPAWRSAADRWAEGCRGLGVKRARRQSGEGLRVGKMCHS
jgi:hypothetical protein